MKRVEERGEMCVDVMRKKDDRPDLNQRALKKKREKRPIRPAKGRNCFVRSPKKVVETRIPRRGANL